jgi:multicomponent Na+:H+ antiporter subunit E
MRPRSWLHRIPATIVFVLTVVWQLGVANVRVALEIVTPGYQMRPGIVRVPTRTRTPMEATMLANLITMTPGTLTLEVDPDTFDLYVHALHLDDVDAFRAEIARTEDRLLKVMR